MNAFTAIAAAIFGITAFGESLGGSPAATVVHAVAIGLVLISVRPLAAAQQRLIVPDATGTTTDGTAGGRSPAAPARRFASRAAL